VTEGIEGWPSNARIQSRLQYLEERRVTDRLDQALRALKAEPSDVRLQGMEARVWQRLKPEAANGAGVVFAFRFAAVIGSLCLGFAAGGLSAASASVRPHEISVFSVGPELAPSTLLESQG
jgi:hypothetical protein